MSLFLNTWAEQCANLFFDYESLQNAAEADRLTDWIRVKANRVYWASSTKQQTAVFFLYLHEWDDNTWSVCWPSGTGRLRQYSGYLTRDAAIRAGLAELARERAS